MRYPKRPLLPGSTLNSNVGQTRFHKSHHLDFVVPGVCYTSDKNLPGIGGVPLAGAESDLEPSIYALGEKIKLPPWLIFDKHALTFDSYYIEPTETSPEYNFVVHRCKIYFFLEDGSIKVVEQKNPFQDGGPSGCIIRRQRVRYPIQGSTEFYDILDFNIGLNVELFGKVFKLIDCDEFTRKFLNRLGISVPDRLTAPEDPHSKLMQEKMKKPCPPVQMNKKMTLEEYLSDDNRKLNFMAYWDDRESPNGLVHLLVICYYLKDDTIEIKDVTDKENIYSIYKRGKLPMDIKRKYCQLGDEEPHTVLNALGPSIEKLRYVLDPLDIGRDHRPIYTDRDMRIGSIVSAFGRKIVIYNCDEFTKQYYRTKYGLENFDPVERPPTKEEELAKLEKKIEFKIPPHNVFGDYEDSLGNCLKLHIETIVKPYTKFLEKDKMGYDSRILRFVAEMLVKNKANGRYFIISYFLKDDSFTVYEKVCANDGFRGGVFMHQRQMLKPGERNVKNRKPEIYTFNDLYIGNTVIFDEFHFRLIASDDYTLRYMETHPSEFPKSNMKLIMEKVKQTIKPIYKSFAASFLEGQEFVPAPYKKFSDTMKAAFGEKITEHEILTIARHYMYECPTEKISLDALRQYTHDELRKKLFNDFERLRECFYHFDPNKCGYVSKKDTYAILRGCRLPLDVEHIRIILERFGKGEQCDIVYNELIQFLNYNCDPGSKHIQPVNISATMSWLNECRPQPRSKVSHIDIDKFLKDLDFEKDLANESK
ncbi:hypothetical protein O3M35_012813 [Rhynocoris fuscipes]|uniref:EF-hand domain-containing family member C2 n=1 Tax=Rhynocoris fuscipes TaxID=488301 RepID=A0AAW1CFM1_9HEMI